MKLKVNTWIENEACKKKKKKEKSELTDCHMTLPPHGRIQNSMHTACTILPYGIYVSMLFWFSEENHNQYFHFIHPFAN